MKQQKSSWLLNPFLRIAGAQALGIGLAAMALTATLAYLGAIHLDGILDLHYCGEAHWSIYFWEGLINWGIMVVLLYLSGAVFSDSKIRLIDVLGTHALARFPFLVMVGVALLTASSTKQVTAYIMSTLHGAGELMAVSAGHWAVFILSTAVSLLTLVWAIIWMYRAYSVSCNLQGKKGIISFIAVLLISEVIAKLIYLYGFEICTPSL